MEFKKLSDVEVVEAVSDAANVQIEENGVIKKAPKTQVGGAGGTEYDAIIELIEGTSGYFDSMELVLGSYQSLKQKIMENKFPEVLIKYADGTAVTGVMKPSSVCLLFIDDQYVIRFDFICYYNHRDIILYPDGHIGNE